MDEAEFGVNDISEEEYKRLKEKTIEPPAHQRQKSLSIAFTFFYIFE